VGKFIAQIPKLEEKPYERAKAILTKLREERYAKSAELKTQLGICHEFLVPQALVRLSKEVDLDAAIQQLSDLVDIFPTDKLLIEGRILFQQARKLDIQILVNPFLHWEEFFTLLYATVQYPKTTAEQKVWCQQVAEYYFANQLQKRDLIDVDTLARAQLDKDRLDAILILFPESSLKNRQAPIEDALALAKFEKWAGNFENTWQLLHDLYASVREKREKLSLAKPEEKPKLEQILHWWQRGAEIWFDTQEKAILDKATPDPDNTELAQVLDQLLFIFPDSEALLQKKREARQKSLVQETGVLTLSQESEEKEVKAIFDSLLKAIDFERSSLSDDEFRLWLENYPENAKKILHEISELEHGMTLTGERQISAVNSNKILIALYRLIDYASRYLPEDLISDGRQLIRSGLVDDLQRQFHTGMDAILIDRRDTVIRQINQEITKNKLYNTEEKINLLDLFWSEFCEDSRMQQARAKLSRTRVKEILASLLPELADLVRMQGIGPDDRLKFFEETLKRYDLPQVIWNNEHFISMRKQIYEAAGIRVG
jgi:hypothetical protein